MIANEHYASTTTPPPEVFLPTKRIMFKLMRASIDCLKVEDLWVRDLP